jgi:hypothetical protein
MQSEPLHASPKSIPENSAPQTPETESQYGHQHELPTLSRPPGGETRSRTYDNEYINEDASGERTPPIPQHRDEDLALLLPTPDAARLNASTPPRNRVTDYENASNTSGRTQRYEGPSFEIVKRARQLDDKGTSIANLPNGTFGHEPSYLDMKR